MQRRLLRFFPDWGYRWQLWENGADKDAMEPVDFGLSEKLTLDLREWYDFWEEHCDPIPGRDTDQNLRTYQTERTLLAADLRREVATFADVSVPGEDSGAD